MPFFTAIDSRAEVKGSRDPLGLVPVWSRLGRRFIGNLTTASASARGFTTLMLGYHFAELITAKDRDVRSIDVFLHMEQVAAYTRLYLHDDSDFRGERRARRMQSRTRSPEIGIGSDTQVLSDQKTYGLWGLYSMPSRSSGILQPGEPVLTRVGREAVEHLYLSLIRTRGRQLERQLENLLLKDGHYFIDARHSELAAALGEVLGRVFSRAERDVFDYNLIRGGPDDRTAGEQARLAALLRELPPNLPFGFEGLEAIIGAARTRPDHGNLAIYLEDAKHLEHVIVPLQAAFLFALSRDGCSIDAIAREVCETWGPLSHVRPDGIRRIRAEIQIAYGDAESADRLIGAAEAMSAGDYNQLLRAALAHNQFLMRVRNGSEPWARLDGDRLNVRYRDETDALPQRDKLATMWRSTYFIDALKSVIDQVDA